MDLVISNCVINLSLDKDRVLDEAFRVLKPGGRLAVSDMMVRGPMPDAVRKNAELWAGCVAGALEEEEYRAKLETRGLLRDHHRIGEHGRQLLRWRRERGHERLHPRDEAAYAILRRRC